jgi:lipopolysaccharide export system protein LptA
MTLSIRTLIAALATTALATAVGSAGRAQQAYKLDPNAPMKFSADGTEVNQSTCVLTLKGKADFTQDRTRLRAGEVTMIQAKDRGRCGDVTRLEARGDVFFVTPEQTVRADNAVYENNGKLVTFTGGVITVQGKNVSVADRVIYNSDTKATTMSGHVQTVYYPEQSDVPFANADANKDGKLDRAEFAVALEAKRASAAPATQPASRPTLTQAPASDAATQFTRYDVNRDGFVSLDEWKYPPSGSPAR